MTKYTEKIHKTGLNKYSCRMHLTKAMKFLDAVSDEYISVEHKHNEKKGEKKVILTKIV